jgi:hypothetical protein
MHNILNIAQPSIIPTTKGMVYKMMMNANYGKFGEYGINMYIFSFHARKEHHNEWVIDIPWNKYSSVYEWCEMMFGASGRSSRYRWRATYQKKERVFLKNNDDFVLFKLRWL